MQLSIDVLDDVSLAKGMLRFWQYQERNALIEYNAAQEEPKSMRRQNEEANRVWRQNNDLGFGPPGLFSDRAIELAELRAKEKEQKYNHAKALLDFYEQQILKRAFGNG